MFESKAALFMYAVSPIHMGAGTALGAIDNPIQRERHTGHPIIAGSGLKGSLRHEAVARWSDKGLVEEVFGPDTNNASEHAGALSLSDAQIVLFPVRSLRHSYIYATCPTALGRLQRTLAIAGIEDAGTWSVPALEADACASHNKELLTDDKLILEAYELKLKPEAASAVAPIAKWLAANALPSSDGFQFFRDKVARDVVVLSDDRFGYFVRNSTLVEPHVRIDDETGTASDGGLFYTENLPSEAVLVSMVMTSKARGKAMTRTASQVFDTVRKQFDSCLLQVGGNASIGRGHAALRFVNGGDHA